jgi:hypothetical protein
MIETSTQSAEVPRADLKIGNKKTGAIAPVFLLPAQEDG